MTIWDSFYDERRTMLENEYSPLVHSILNAWYLPEYKSSHSFIYMGHSSYISDFYMLSFSSDFLSNLLIEDTIEKSNMVFRGLEERNQTYYDYYHILVDSLALIAIRNYDSFDRQALYAVATLYSYNKLTKISENLPSFRDIVDVDPYVLAQLAYDGGFRHLFIYETLLVMYSDNQDEINRLHREMDIMNYRY